MNFNREDFELASQSCSPTKTATIYGGGWNWWYPATFHKCGTAGNLNIEVNGYVHIWENLNDSSDVEEDWQF